MNTVIWHCYKICFLVLLFYVSVCVTFPPPPLPLMFVVVVNPQQINKRQEYVNLNYRIHAVDEQALDIHLLFRITQRIVDIDLKMRRKGLLHFLSYVYSSSLVLV